jgi:signal transduction histidine kinase
MRLFRSVGGRLALALLVVVAGALTIVYLIVVPSYRSSLVNTELGGLESSLRNVAVPNFPAEPYLQQEFASEYAPIVNARVVVYDLLDPLAGQLVVAADSNEDGRPEDVENDEVAFDAIRQNTLARGVVSRNGQDFAEVAYPLGSSVVLLRSSLHDQLQSVSVVRRRVFVAGAAALLFAVALGYAGASLFTTRIRRLESAAERIAAGSFDEPVVDHGGDELGQLARTFERMRLRLADLDRARGEFIANASHELRTPLFSLGGFLELLDDPELDEATREEFLQQMREQVARLTKLATDLLDLSRLDAGRLSVVREPLDLHELAEELAAELGPRAASTGHTVEVSGGPAPVLADAERVLQIGRGLLDNALLHTPPGTAVRIETGREGTRATLTVANDGPPIPAEAREQVFQRFYRLDGSRASGSGLGLAIARELAGVMDGRIELTEEGGWTRFTLALAADDELDASPIRRENGANRMVVRNLEG